MTARLILFMSFAPCMFEIASGIGTIPTASPDILRGAQT